MNRETPGNRHLQQSSDEPAATGELPRVAPMLLSLLARHRVEGNLLHEAVRTLARLIGAREAAVVLLDEQGEIDELIDCCDERRFTSIDDLAGVAGQLSARIAVDGRCFGHVYLSARHGGFDTADQRLAEDFCQALALALGWHRETSRRQREDSELRRVAQAVSPSTGQAFFHELVLNLSQALGVEYAFVGKVAAAGLTQVETVAVCAGGRLVDNFSYHLAGTPCEHVVDSRVCYHAHDVQRAFPDDEMLVAMGAESYLGVPLMDSSGRPIGLLAILHTATLDRSAHVQSILEISATRATAELERLIAETALQEKTRELQGINRAMASYLQGGDWRHASEVMLRTVLASTGSERGFAGIVIDDTMRVIAIDAGVATEHSISGVDHLPGDIVRRGKPVLINGGGDGRPLAGTPLEAIGHHALLVAPMQVGDAIIGLIGVADRADGYRHAEQQRVELFAGTASVLFDGYLRRQREIRSERKLEFLAYYDPLTMLPNRRLLHKHLDRAIHESTREQDLLAVLYLDLDRFKIINDTMGHLAGDQLLRETGERLTASLRPGDTVARISGDEFIIVLTQISDADDVATIVQHLLDRFAQPIEVHGRELFASLSIGVALFPIDGDRPETLIKQADTALYHAKEQGRNNFQFYTTRMNERAHRRLSLETSLRRALDRDEFMLEYQPQLDLVSGRVTGIEALLRWRSAEHGTVPPVDFIPLAEDTGLIMAIGEWVLHEACRQTQRLHDDHGADLRVAVNLSARQLQDTRLLDGIRGALADSGLDPRRLELELTESMLTTDSEQILTAMNELGRLGVAFSIDDFGTGYSALGYLKRFPLSTLKIDRSFVRDIGDDSGNAAIVRAVIMMAHGLGMKVIAEGVEHGQQLEALKAFGCDMIQGYHFCRPLPSPLLIEFLDRHPV